MDGDNTLTLAISGLTHTINPLHAAILTPPNSYYPHSSAKPLCYAKNGERGL